MNQDMLTRGIATLVIILIPFWTLPIIPGSFKPISVFICFPLAFLFFIQRLFVTKKIDKTDFVLLLFLITGVLYSTLIYLFEGLILSNFIIGIALFIIGISYYFGFKYILKTVGLNAFLRLIQYSIYIVIIIGWIDLLSFLGVLPDFIRSFLNHLVAGKSSSRIILTVSEPAWASRLVLCLMPFAFLIWKRYKRKVDLFTLLSLVIFFIFTFSLSGFLVLIVVSGLILISKISFSVLLKTIAVLSVIFGLFYVTYLNIKDDGNYFVSRIQKIVELKDLGSLMSLENLASFDGSAMIRIGYPIISMQIFLDNPFGIGVGRYGEYFNREIVNYGKSVTENAQVVSHVDGISADQRSFYTKVLTEHGIFITSLLILFYIMIHKKLKKLSILLGKNSKLEINILYVSLLITYANMIQFASYLFPFFWLIPAIISICYEQKRTI